jgi:large subunit ribosomal protein L24
MKIRKSDTVIVTTGKDKGKKGKVHGVITDKQRVLVEGVNVVKRHMKPRANIRQAGIIEREAPIHISNVMYFCSKCNKATRLGARVLEDGTKVRICKRCQEVAG